jgi:hypothetical protein
LFTVRSVVVIATVAGVLLVAGTASASRPATTAELTAMQRAGFTTGAGNFVEWARISTRDARYAIFYAKRCAVTARCGSQTRPTYGFLLHRRTTAARSPWQLLAQAQLRPPYRPEITRLCRAEPRRVRADLLGAICR